MVDILIDECRHITGAVSGLSLRLPEGTGAITG
ncbi:hypothetical protein W822_07835 [Advenella kashmirensis W13003]|uniref:Uncharacterized protein n=1 Tax=Advenella kashmirensis W13003 TaxID=1424334 RepID=V8QVS6_9BURK|nr:hypothetical protein W822_07835 [Advenella kashmirensis W13003]